MRAAAPPPTALNSDTSCGIAVIWTVRAVYSPSPPPSAMPATMIAQPPTTKPSPRSCWERMRTAVAPIARVMPAADSRLPFRAVAGEFIWTSPRTNATAPRQPGDPDEDFDPAEGIHWFAYASASASAGLGAVGFFRNIWSIRSVTT